MLKLTNKFQKMITLYTALGQDSIFKIMFNMLNTEKTSISNFSFIYEESSMINEPVT